MGLPPHPVWWTYFGPQYTQHIDRTRPGVTDHGKFALMELANDPTDREALATNLPRRGLLRRRVPWVETDLQMTALTTDPRRSPPNAERARVVPLGLGVRSAAPGYRI